jgi:ribonuclease P protein component
MSLPAGSRLRFRPAFEQIYRQGKRRKGSLCALAWLPIPGKEGCPSDSYEPSTQFAVVVSKKVSRQAVQRNRIRRWIKAALYPLLSQVKPGYWVIITARESAQQAQSLVLQKEVVDLVTAAGLLNSGSQGREIDR